MVDEKDYFRDNMDRDDFEKALSDFVEACEKEGQQVPLWARMQLGEEEIIPPDYDEVNDPELQEALEEIDKEFGVKK